MAIRMKFRDIVPYALVCFVGVLIVGCSHVLNEYYVEGTTYRYSSLDRKLEWICETNTEVIFDNDILEKRKEKTEEIIKVNKGLVISSAGMGYALNDIQTDADKPWLAMYIDTNGGGKIKCFELNDEQFRDYCLYVDKLIQLELELLKIADPIAVDYFLNVVDILGQRQVSHVEKILSICGFSKKMCMRAEEICNVMNNCRDLLSSFEYAVSGNCASGWTIVKPVDTIS